MKLAWLYPAGVEFDGFVIGFGTDPVNFHGKPNEASYGPNPSFNVYSITELPLFAQVSIKARQGGLSGAYSEPLIINAEPHIAGTNQPGNNGLPPAAWPYLGA